MSRVTVVGIALPLALLPATAFADVQYASAAALDAVLSGGPFSFLNGTSLANTTGAPDAVIVQMNNGAGGGLVRIHWSFSEAAHTPDFTLYKLVGQFGSSITQVAWSTSNFASAITAAKAVALTGVATDTTITTSASAFSTAFTANTYTELFVTFNFAGGAGIETDAVSSLNPEPGTIALFGIGVAGLGGLAWKRRRSRATAAQRA